jgi:TorA maturation chaperone TorD
MRQNEAYAWAPSAPFRAYYGDMDRDVAPENAKFFAREASQRGGHVQAVSVGPQDHFGTVVHAIPLIRRWFDQLSAPSNNRP